MPCTTIYEYRYVSIMQFRLRKRYLHMLQSKSTIFTKCIIRNSTHCNRINQPKIKTALNGGFEFRGRGNKIVIPTHFIREPGIVSQCQGTKSYRNHNDKIKIGTLADLNFMVVLGEQFSSRYYQDWTRNQCCFESSWIIHSICIFSISVSLISLIASYFTTLKNSPYTYR